MHGDPPPQPDRHASIAPTKATPGSTGLHRVPAREPIATRLLPPQQDTTSAAPVGAMLAWRSPAEARSPCKHSSYKSNAERNGDSGCACTRNPSPAGWLLQQQDTTGDSPVGAMLAWRSAAEARSPCKHSSYKSSAGLNGASGSACMRNPSPAGWLPPQQDTTGASPVGAMLAWRSPAEARSPCKHSSYKSSAGLNGVSGCACTRTPSPAGWLLQQQDTTGAAPVGAMLAWRSATHRLTAIT